MLQPRDLPLLPVFVAVVGHGSFTAAARELGLAKSVVSQHVRALEARCGVRLLERTTRSVRITQIGEQVLEQARAVMASVRSLDDVLQSHRDAPSGTLRVTAPQELGVAVAAVGAQLCRAHSALTFDLLVDDSKRDLVADRIDVAIRIGPPEASSYIRRRIGVEPEILVASPALAGAYPDLAQPRQLQGAPWIAHSMLRPRGTWVFVTASGARQQIDVALRVSASATDAVIAACRAGAGFAVLPRHMVAAEIAGGGLVQVCPTWFRRNVTLHALLPSRQPPPRASLFLTALTEALRPLF
jgi:DNA-binding transcriptional LysR family regulator